MSVIDAVMEGTVTSVLPQFRFKFLYAYGNWSKYNVNVTIFGPTHLYVNKISGDTHENGCGDWDHPCSTLFDVSKRMEFQMRTDSTEYYPDVVIHVMNGQNETRIRDIIQHNLAYYTPQLNRAGSNFHHPCLLYIGDKAALQNLTIVFNASAIHDLNDWFPQTICNRDDTYSNRYMFEVGIDSINEIEHLTIHNLIINDYFSDSLGVAAKRWNVGTFSCYNCQFRNIVFATNKWNNPPFYAMADIYFVDNIFDNITVEYTLVHSGHYYDAGDIALDTYRNIVIKRSRFIGIVSQESLIEITRILSLTYMDVDVAISDTEFHNISTELHMILDETYAADIVLSNVWMNITTGSVYKSLHSVASIITINNMSLSTTAKNHQTEALFVFASADTVTTYNMNVSYFINAMDYWCGWSVSRVGSCASTAEFIMLSHLLPESLWFNQTIGDMMCVNPTPFITNYGHLVMNDTTIGLKPQNEFMWRAREWLDACYHNEYAKYAFTTGSFFINKNVMEINDMLVTRTISRHFIHNERDLIINDAIFHADPFNPNALHSSRIINQLGGASSTLFVYNSYFMGARVHIYGKQGTFHILNSVLQHAQNAIHIENSASVVLQHSRVTNNGLYHAPFFSTAYENLTDATQPVIIFDSDQVNIKHNLFTGYDPHGLVHLSGVSQASLVNNTFLVRGDELYYGNISAEEVGFEAPYTPLTVDDSESVDIINNKFTENFVDANLPWLRLWEVNDACITGNLFNNTGFEAEFTQITSCFRRQLADCAILIREKQVNATRYYDCLKGIYGDMDINLIDDKNMFVVGDDVSSINKELIFGYKSGISLDNIDIVYKKTKDVVFATLSESILLLVDANMNGMDVASHVNHTYLCEVPFNDRLAHDAQQISRFLMDCNGKTAHHSPLNKVNYLSVTNIEFVADSMLYYPGKLLTFNYYLSDRMDEIVSYDRFSTIIDLFDGDSNQFLDSFNIENNECAQCEHGLFLNYIAMDDVDKKYAIVVQSEEKLVAKNPVVNIVITGCPVGYSPDNKGFICQQCNTDYYSLAPNNTEDCVSCDPENNEGIKCIAGEIHVSYNNWMGFDEEAIISAQCPLNYCCANKTGCSYGANLLCAENRDDSSILCGKCIDGYSESLRSTQCVLCDQSFYGEQMLAPILLALLWAIGLIFLSSSRNKTAHQKKWKLLEAIGITKYLSNPHFILMLRILFTRNIIYYEQALSQILSFAHNPFRTLCEMFNLSMSRNESDDKFARCFIRGMNAKHKILMDLFMPIMTVFFIVIAQITSSSIKQTKVPILLKYRKYNFAKCYSVAFLLTVGNILNVLFRLMHCQSVGPLSVHYYFGDEICFQQTWTICFVCLLLIIAIFIIIEIQLARIGHEARCNKSSVYFIFVDKYKPQCFWWEFVLFSRRICIAMFSVTFTDDNCRVIFAILIFIFLAAHWKYEPFVVQSANHMECCLLVSTVIVIMVQTTRDMADQFKSSLVIIAVLLPFILLAYYIALFVVHKKRDDLAVSLIKKRLMYLILGVMMYYMPKTAQTNERIIAVDDENDENQDDDDDIQVMCDDDDDDDDEKDVVAIANHKVKKLDKNIHGNPWQESEKDPVDSSRSLSAFEDVVAVDSDASVSGDSGSHF